MQRLSKLPLSRLIAHGCIVNKNISTSKISFFRCYTNKINSLFKQKHTLWTQHKDSNLNLSSIPSNSQSKRKYKIPLIVGLVAATGGVVYGYTHLKHRPEDEESDKDDYIPFVEEHLDRNLDLLEEFGPVPYLLVGAGSASFTAFRSIRTKHPTAKVLIIGDEEFLPYMRPPLSKEMWFDDSPDVAETLSFRQWNGNQRSIFYEPPEFFFPIPDLLENKNGGISILRGLKVTKVDPVSQSVYLDNGRNISYEKCLLAPGVEPKNLSVFDKAEPDIQKQIILFKNIRDFRKLDQISRKAKSVAIVGGGLLGSELAIGLSRRSKSFGLEVTQLFSESGNLSEVLPEYLSKWTMNKIEAEGVKIIPDVVIKSVSKDGDNILLNLSNDKTVLADYVIVAVGADVNTKLAKTSGLETDEKLGGFVVNAELEARKNLWVAGDAACFYDIKLGRRRIEHHDHALVTGRLAGENMAGGNTPYLHQSIFWSDLGPISLEAVGIVDPALPTVGIFAKDTEVSSNEAETKTSSTSEAPKELVSEAPKLPESEDNYSKGVVFYLRDNIIVGVILWNVFAKSSVARKVINESKSYDDLAEVAKLFELHSTE